MAGHLSEGSLLTILLVIWAALPSCHRPYHIPARDARLVLVHDDRFLVLSETPRESTDDTGRQGLEADSLAFDSYAAWRTKSRPIEDFAAILKAHMIRGQTWVLIIPIEPRDDRAVAYVEKTATNEGAMVVTIRGTVPAPWPPTIREKD